MHWPWLSQLRTRLSAVKHGPIIDLVMARVRKNGKSSQVNSVISEQTGGAEMRGSANAAERTGRK